MVAAEKLKRMRQPMGEGLTFCMHDERLSYNLKGLGSHSAAVLVLEGTLGTATSIEI